MQEINVEEMKTGGENYLNYLAERIWKEISKNNLQDFSGVIADVHKFFDPAITQSIDDVKKLLDNMNLILTKDYIVGLNQSGLLKSGVSLHQGSIEGLGSLIQKYCIFKHRCVSHLEKNDVTHYKTAVWANQKELRENTGTAGMKLLDSILQWISNRFFQNHSEKIVNPCEPPKEESHPKVK